MRVIGDRFIWSFLSGSTVLQHNGELWGFRFTVTPVFPSPTVDELEQQCEQEYVKEIKCSKNWTLAMDHELVSFVNSYCEKSLCTSQEVTCEKINISELTMRSSLG
jgi:hypothetical protein